MKKLLMIIIGIVVFFISKRIYTNSHIIKKDNLLLTEVKIIEKLNGFNEQTRNDEFDKCLLMYEEFLAGARKAYLTDVIENHNLDGGLEMNDITIPTGEPDIRYATKYAIFDSNFDGIPELHLKSARYYYILSHKDNELFIWKDFSPNPHYYPLKNGTFMMYNPRSGPMHDDYNYFALDFLGNIVWSLSFSRYDRNQNGFYDENDEYFHDGVEVTKNIWDDLTKTYFTVNSDGRETIANEIEWIIIYDETTYTQD